MNKNEYAFYEDQKGPRQGKCTNAVEKLAESDLNFIKEVTSKENDVPSTSSINFDSAFDMTMTEIGSDTIAKVRKVLLPLRLTYCFRINKSSKTGHL